MWNFPFHSLPERRRCASSVRDLVQDTLPSGRAGGLENDRAVSLPTSRRVRSVRHTSVTVAPPATAIFFSLSDAEKPDPLAVRRKERGVRVVGAMSEGVELKLIECGGRRARLRPPVWTTNTATLPSGEMHGGGARC